MLEQTEEQAKTQDRLEKALGWHDASDDQRDALVAAIVAAGGLGFFTWDQLPEEAQKIVEELEKTQQTGWDDPSDVPDDTPDDF